MKASKISLNITYESIKKSQRKQVLLHVFFCHYIGKKKNFDAQVCYRQLPQ